MGAAISAAILIITKYGFLLDIAGTLWAQFQKWQARGVAVQKDTDVSKQIDASVAGADDASLDERLRHYQRD